MASRPTTRRAAKPGAGQARAPESGGRRECMPCAGRGAVISKLGGEPHSEQCPWCGGTGERQQGIDAQARWQSEDGEPAAAQAEVGVSSTSV